MNRACTCLSVLVLAACSRTPKVDYQAYSGTAYPSRSARIAWPASGAALVSNTYDDTLSAVDLASGKVFFTRGVGVNPVDIDGPHHVAVDPSGRFAFTVLTYPRVAPTGPHAAHGSSAIPGYVEKISLDDFSIVGNVPVHDSPGDIVMSDDRKRLVVSHFDLQRALEYATDINQARATLAVVDPTTIAMAGSPRPTFVTVCVAPNGLALDAPSGSHAYVACYGEDSIAVVDIDDPTAPVERIPVASDVSGFGVQPKYGPSDAVLSPDQRTVALSDAVSHDVRFFDLASKTFDLTKTIQLPGTPSTPLWSADGQTLYIPMASPDALVIAPLNGQPTKTVSFDPATCVKPNLVSLVGGRYYVVCEGNHADPTQTTPGSLVVLDASVAVVSSSPLGKYPNSLTSLPSGFQ